MSGPGYPLVLALISAVTGDLFGAGKWLSVVSAALAGLLAFILFSRLFGYWVGIGSQLLLLVITRLPIFALNATTDLFFLLLCLASLVVFTSEKLSLKWRVGLTAALVGFTYLTRYNGVFLLVTCLIGLLLLNVFEQSWKSRLKLAGLFTGIFILVVSPWLLANYQHRGSPFYNTNYLNIATQFYPELAKDSVFQDGARSWPSGSIHSVTSSATILVASQNAIPPICTTVLKRRITFDAASPWVGCSDSAGGISPRVD